MTLLVLIPIVTVLVVDQATCLTCAADEPFWEAFEGQPGLEKFDSVCAPGEGDSEDGAEFVCPLCISRLFSLSASSVDSGCAEVTPFLSRLSSIQEQDSYQSIFRPPQA